MEGTEQGEVREFRYISPKGRKATEYEELTVHTQWDPKNWARQGWFTLLRDGRAFWREDSTLLSSTNWWAFRDPSQLWYRPYIDLQAKQEETIETTTEGARKMGLFADITPGWLTIIGNY